MALASLRGFSFKANRHCRGCLCYNITMKQKPLIETNPYLRDPEKLRKALITSVASSTAIETGASVESIARMLEETKNTAPLKTTQRSSR